MWDYVLRSSSISFDGYGSKIQKVSRHRPAVSNETILANRQEFLFHPTLRFTFSYRNVF